MRTRTPRIHMTRLCIQGRSGLFFSVLIARSYSPRLFKLRELEVNCNVCLLVGVIMAQESFVIIKAKKM